MSSPRHRVAILDDHAYIVHSLERLLDSESGLGVTITATDAAEFMARVADDPPDIAVVDLSLDGKLVGHFVLEQLTAAGIPALAFTADERPVPVRLAMRAGARGLVLKSDPINALADAIRAVIATGWAPSSATATTVLERADQLPNLSGQEIACLRQAAQGVPIKSIGRRLDPPITSSTVRTYLNRAHARYAEANRQMSTTIEVVLQAERDGWFDA